MATERAFPAARALASPSAIDWPLVGTERLRLTGRFMNATNTITLAGRLWRAADREVVPFSHTFVQGLIGSLVQEVPLQAGVLLSLYVTATQGSTDVLGETFARVELIQGDGAAATVLAALVQGYVNSENALGWPGSPLQNQHAGFGVPTLAPATFATGPLRYTWTVPTGRLWRVVAGRAIFTASAVVATRNAYVTLTDALGNAFSALPSTSGIVANEVLGINFGPGLTLANPSIGQQSNVATPDLLLTTGDVLSVTTSNNQIGDTLTNGVLRVQEYFSLP